MYVPVVYYIRLSLCIYYIYYYSTYLLLARQMVGGRLTHASLVGLLLTLYSTSSSLSFSSDEPSASISESSIIGGPFMGSICSSSDDSSSS
mmetsp:Transcript_12051/g.11620  ORF Transcript_12051/g.11620 Transcript_12051/m.11620 type:complete len:91 (-) Transcript_12051:745-1017(-)